MPPWATDLGGWATPWLCDRLGTHRTVTLARAGLALSLAERGLRGPVPVLSGMALACLPIAVLGTMLPLLARGSAGYPLRLGLGSTAGTLVTPAAVTTLS